MTTETPRALDVTQADRDAAEAWEIGRGEGSAHVRLLSEVFARHRIEALREREAEVERLREALKALRSELNINGGVLHGTIMKAADYWHKRKHGSFPRDMVEAHMDALCEDIDAALEPKP